MLGHFLNHGEAWQHLAAEAPGYAAEWSDEALAGRMADLYRQIVTAHVSSRVDVFRLLPF